MPPWSVRKKSKAEASGDASLRRCKVNSPKNVRISVRSARADDFRPYSTLHSRLAGASNPPYGVQPGAH